MQKQPSTWRQILRQNFTRLDRLADFLELEEEQRRKLLSSPSFSLNLPMRLAKKMAKKNLEDPLFKQFVPLQAESLIVPHFTLDPVGDLNCRYASKLLRKYTGRVLLVCTSACAMHCRYCFRQNFDYEVQDKTFTKELEAIEKDLSIHEVILSGGDPLSLSDEILDELLGKISNMPHIKRIRFHTRFPIGIPERIDDEFLAVMQKIKQQVWFVIHVNHPRELDEDLFERLKPLQQMGWMILNQSVLLKGINDDVQTLKELCETLADRGVLPYYLHQLDRVQRAAHFEVEEDKGRWLIQEISKVLPGYAVPKYVREIAGEPNKTPL